jgi:hypothetical protein
MARSAKEKLEKLLEFVNKEENLFTEFSMKAMEKGNMMAMQIHNAEACAYTKMRFTIEDMLSHNGSNPAWESMEFNEAYGYLREGKKIKLPEWNGYWYWSDDRKTIMIHCENGKELDIRDTKNTEYTFGCIVRNDWMVIKDE